MNCKIGVDIGGTNIAIGVLDDRMNIIAKSTERFLKVGGAVGVVNRLHEQICTLVNEAKLSILDINGIGVAVPGSVDLKQGIIHDAFNLGFKDVPLKQMIAESFGGSIPVSVLNDADAAANAELCLGALRGVQTAVFITLGTGVGGAIIINGKLFCGGMGNGTEPGHVILKLNGHKCSCSQRGCAETMCAASSLTIAARRAKKSERMSPLYNTRNGKLTAKLVTEMAQKGIQPAVRLFEDYTSSLAAYISSLINLLDPEVVCIGGGMSNTGEFLLQKVTPKVEARCFFRNHAKVILAHFKNDAGIIGAACEL